MISRSGLFLSVHLHCVLHPVEHVPGHHQRHVQRGQGRDGGGRGKIFPSLFFIFPYFDQYKAFDCGGQNLKIQNK